MPTKPEHPQQWEYLVEAVRTPPTGHGHDPLRDVRAVLNRRGAEGWELVNVTSTVKTVGNIFGNDLLYTFKRPGVGDYPAEPDVPWA